MAILVAINAQFGELKPLHFFYEKIRAFVVVDFELYMMDICLLSMGYISYIYKHDFRMLKNPHVVVFSSNIMSVCWNSNFC